jgi:hypothetical protein
MSHSHALAALLFYGLALISFCEKRGDEGEERLEGVKGENNRGRCI